MVRTSPLALALLLAPALAVAGDYRPLPGGDFRSAVRLEPGQSSAPVAPFAMMARPVSNAEFAAFVARHPRWRRDRAPAVFVERGYLGHWSAPDTPGDDVDPAAPVAHVSWFAADAYCRAQQARLPTFLEWEYAAAADATRADARGDPARRAQRVHDGTPRAIDARASAPANVHGLHGLHGANWEWAADANALLGDTDRRGQDDGDRLPWCGATALGFSDPGDYAVVKRFVLLSSLEPRSDLGNLGFRCARSQP